MRYVLTVVPCSSRNYLHQVRHTVAQLFHWADIVPLSCVLRAAGLTNTVPGAVKHIRLECSERNHTPVAGCKRGARSQYIKKG